MSEILVAAPHPDDETLGCAGALLRHQNDGDRVHWIIFTEMREEFGYSTASVQTRRDEIAAVTRRFAFESVHSLGFQPAGLDAVPMSRIVESLSDVFRDVRPNVVYIPHRGDAHSDHTIAFDALAACTKWFRYPSVHRVLSYEALSETDASIAVDKGVFVPNVFIDIAPYLDEKIAIAKLYRSEIAEFPFPRSERALRALAAIRGAAAGYEAAEAFMLQRERIDEPAGNHGSR